MIGIGTCDSEENVPKSLTPLELGEATRANPIIAIIEWKKINGVRCRTLSAQYDVGKRDEYSETVWWCDEEECDCNRKSHVEQNDTKIELIFWKMYAVSRPRHSMEQWFQRTAIRLSMGEYVRSMQIPKVSSH